MSPRHSPRPSPGLSRAIGAMTVALATATATLPSVSAAAGPGAPASAAPSAEPPADADAPTSDDAPIDDSAARDSATEADDAATEADDAAAEDEAAATEADDAAAEDGAAAAEADDGGTDALDEEIDEELDAVEPVDDADEGPPPLTTLQTTGWWTLFGAFALGTTAGVFAGLAERQEDRALRLATLFDAETGQQPLYADRADEYEKYLRRGKTYQNTAIGLAAVTGAAVIAAITVFAIDASRRRAGNGRQARRRSQWRARGAGWEVRF